MLSNDERIEEAARKIIASDPFPVEFATAIVDALFPVSHDGDHDRRPERVLR
jgi:hypothetical protein